MLDPTARRSPSTPAPHSAVERLLRRLAPRANRRFDQRLAAPYLFRLTPLDDPGRGRPGSPTGAAITVVGKDLSHHGVGFYHELPLPFRRVRLTLDDPRIGQFDIDAQLDRCRFTKLGWYESGGRILSVSDAGVIDSLAG